MKTIQELRKDGWKVRVIHRRFYSEQRSTNILMSRLEAENYDKDVLAHTRLTLSEPKPRGGYTEINITTPDGREATGIAECSVNENFNRRHGVKVALGRALSQLQ